MKQNYGYLIILVTALVGCGGGGSKSEALEPINTAPQLIGLIDFAIDENTTLWKTEINYFKVNFWPVKVMMRLFPNMFKKQGEKWWNQFKDFAEKQ